MKKDKAIKHDSGKPDLSLIPQAAMEEMAYAFMLGEKKYGRYNYYSGMTATRLISASLRHIWEYLDGKNTDPESGRNPLGHAMASLAMVLQQEKLGTLIDNRLPVLQVEVPDDKTEPTPPAESKESSCSCYTQYSYGVEQFWECRDCIIERLKQRNGE